MFISDGIKKEHLKVNSAETLLKFVPQVFLLIKPLRNIIPANGILPMLLQYALHCSVGCNIIVSERYGIVRRIMNRYNGAVNGYFICDRGRFGYEFINGPERIRKVISQRSGSY